LIQVKNGPLISAPGTLSSIVWRNAKDKLMMEFQLTEYLGFSASRLPALITEKFSTQNIQTEEKTVQLAGD
jgi:hypothetical protein